MFGLDLAVPLVDNELAKLGGLGEMPSLPDGIYLFSEDLTSGGTVLFDLPNHSRQATPGISPAPRVHISWVKRLEHRNVSYLAQGDLKTYRKDLKT